jgi:hypothetical protein
VPAAGVNLGTRQYTVNVEPAFVGWYQNPQSQQFGSLFTVSIPFTGTVSTALALPDAFESVSVRVSNSLGASPAQTASMR